MIDSNSKNDCTQYIIFSCSKCLYSSKDVKHVEKHIINCNVLENNISLDNKLFLLQKEVLNLKKELDCEKQKFYTQIRLEKLKNKIYSKLIESNTDILINDVLTEEEDGIHLYNGIGPFIPINVHELMKGEEGINIIENKKLPLPLKRSRHRNNEASTLETIDDSSKSRKKSYRSVKTCLNIVAELSEQEKTEKNKLIDEKNQEILEKFGDLKEVRKSFQETFEKLKSSRVYTKILEDLSKKRSSIFPRMSLTAYENLVTEHVKTIEDIFRAKNYTDKKSINIIFKGLTPLESRLISYYGYTQSHLEIDEIQKLDIVLDLEKQIPKEYVTYDSVKFFNCFYNYGLVLFSVKKNIERYLFNRYGFHNVIYLPMPKNTEDDPYSFYILDKISKEKRYWKMDCRLEDLSGNLSFNILPYMIGMFRKLYRDVFGDNDFRSDFSKKCQLTECDCEQLLQNIILVGQPKEFYNIIRTIVKNKATYTPTENDKFNLYGDDALQRKRFHEKEDVDIVDIIKQLFDDISSEEAVDFYRSRTNLK